MLKYSSNKRIFLATSIIFGLILAVITGISFYAPLPDDVTPFDGLREAPVGPVGIFLNNIALALGNILLALPTFGLYPVITLAMNAVALGLLIKYLAESEQQVLILKLLPHGIIELFGLAFSVALILTLALNVLKTIPPLIRGEESMQRFFRTHLTFLASGIAVEIVIFLVAAAVETAVSYIKLL